MAARRWPPVRRRVRGNGTSELLAKAFERARARFCVLDPDARLSFDVLAEARAEARVELARRIERDRRVIRKAARRIAEAEALALALAPEPDPVAEFRRELTGNGPPWLAVPPRHPDHDHPRNDIQET